jgi:hypothetical protein
LQESAFQEAGALIVRSPHGKVKVHNRHVAGDRFVTKSLFGPAELALSRETFG